MLARDDSIYVGNHKEVAVGLFSIDVVLIADEY